MQLPTAPAIQNQAATTTSLDSTIRMYCQGLIAARKDRSQILPVLTIRDNIYRLQREQAVVSPPFAQILVKLDQSLRETLEAQPVPQLEVWRSSFLPPAEAWWWWIEPRLEQNRQLWRYLWHSLAAIFWLLGAAVATEIVTRLWSGAPDTFSFFGTWLMIVLTGGLWTKPVQTAFQQLAERIPRRPPAYQAFLIASASLLVLVLLTVIRMVGFPLVAKVYNDQGVAAISKGQLFRAQQQFQRAISLNPDLVVPYTNLGDVHARSGRFGEAERWYIQAIERDRNFLGSYERLGELYNQQGKHQEAERILIAGLDILGATIDNQRLTVVMRYKLLANLGWALFEQGSEARAQQYLERSVALADQVRALNATGTEDRVALPHYILAQIYERQGRTGEAIQQWENALRFLKPDNWQDHARLEFVQTRLNKYQTSTP